MLIMTSERCPDCDAIIYCKPSPKTNNKGEIILTQHTSDIDGTGEVPHSIADGCYLDRDGVLVITRFDEDSCLPDYVCIFCGWIA